MWLPPEYNTSVKSDIVVFDGNRSKVLHSQATLTAWITDMLPGCPSFCPFQHQII